MKRSLLVVLFSSMTLVTTGCFSIQSYGSATRGHSAREARHRAEVLANLGEPTSVYRSANSEAFFYKGYQGANYFGLWHTIQRIDTVVVMDGEGNVLTVEEIDAGKGLGVLSPPIGDSHPVSTRVLREGPQNYHYGYDVEAGQ